jgi:hypothetical protein
MARGYEHAEALEERVMTDVPTKLARLVRIPPGKNANNQRLPVRFLGP